MDSIMDLIESEEKADLLTLFHNDARLSGTSEQIAARLGRNPAEVQRALEDFVGLGIIKKVDGIYSYPPDKDRMIQTLIQAAMKSDSER
jgi:DNA-binding Lrp family transcriptional regulator